MEELAPEVITYIYNAIQDLQANNRSAEEYLRQRSHKLPLYLSHNLSTYLGTLNQARAEAMLSPVTHQSRYTYRIRQLLAYAYHLQQDPTNLPPKDYVQRWLNDPTQQALYTLLYPLPTDRNNKGTCKP